MKFRFLSLVLVLALSTPYLAHGDTFQFTYTPNYAFSFPPGYNLASPVYDALSFTFDSTQPPAQILGTDFVLAYELPIMVNGTQVPQAQVNFVDLSQDGCAQCSRLAPAGLVYETTESILGIEGNNQIVIHPGTYSIFELGGGGYYEDGDGTLVISDTTPSPVPEPGSLPLLATGLLISAGVVRGRIGARKSRLSQEGRSRRGISS